MTVGSHTTIVIVSHDPPTVESRIVRCLWSVVRYSDSSVTRTSLFGGGRQGPR